MKKILISLLAIVFANTAFAQLNPLSIGTIEAGDSIIVYYNVKINTPFPASRIATKGNVSGSNFSTVTTDDPDTGTGGDSTYTDVISNFRPQFTAGANTIFIVCPNSTSNSINSILAALDTDNGQTLDWTILTGPVNGSVSGFPYSTSTTGSTVTPTGLSYTPTTSYVGVDSFFVKISDGSDSDTLIVRVRMTEINVQGNSTSISDDDVTPTTADHTDFGNQSICSGTIVRTYTIQNTGSGNLIITGVNITGSAAGDYSVTTSPSSPVAPAGSTTFQVTFDPSVLGARDATVNIASSDCDESAYDFAITGTGVDPEINVTGNSVSISDGDATPTTADHTDFGNQSVCSGTVVRTFTIENTGTSGLTITSVSITGTGSGDYSVTSSASSPVSTSGSTSFDITFNPSTSGARNATISIVTNDCDEATYDFAITGTGIDAEANVTGNGISIADGNATPSTTDHTDFGSQAVCSGTIVRTFTIENTGNVTGLTLGTVTISGTNAGDFSVTTNPSSPVSTSGSTTFQVTFNPSALGLRSADISFSTNDCDENPYNFSIQGTGTDAEVDVKGNSISIADGDATPSTADHTDFGNQAACSGTVVRTFTIENTGNVTGLTLGTVTITGTNASDFTVTTTPSSPVSTSGSTTFQVTFDPSALGLRSADISFSTNDCDENPYNFSIQGTGTGSEANVTGNSVSIADGDATPSLADHTDFGSQNVVSGTIVRTFTIENSGNTDLTVSGLNITGTNSGDFSVTTSPSSPVSGSGSTTFQITFDPSAIGVRNATITFTTNDCDEGTYNFDITGVGANQEINVQGNSTTIVDGDNTPSLADHTKFGDIAPSSSLTRTFTIQNTGTDILILSNISLSGTHSSLFSLSSITFPDTVDPSSSRTFTVTFTPTSGGLKNAVVTISNNDADEANYDFAIQGERSCYTNSITGTTTNDGIYTGGVGTNIYIGYGAQKDTLKAIGFGPNVSWSPGTNLSCTSSCSTTVFSPTAAGSYTFTASNGCISNTVTICVKDIRVPGTSGSRAAVYMCHKEPVKNTTQTLAVLLRGIPGHFQYHSGDKLGVCGNTCAISKRTIEFTDLVVDEQYLEVMCTPNPFRNSFKLNYISNSEELATVSIYGMTGNLLEKVSLAGVADEKELGTNLPNGIYTVSFIQGDKNRVFRMIKVD